MILELKRQVLTDKSTIGRLSVDGREFCWTLEDVVRPDGVKIYGKTAIPAGQYEVIINWSNRFKRLLPLLLRVPRFEGIRIHSGNTAENTEGCILVGYTMRRDWIGQSRLAFRDLFGLMREAAGKEKIHIGIY